MCFWNTLIWNLWGSYPGSNSKRDSQNFVELYGFVVSRVESSQTGNSRFRLTRLSGFQVFRLAAERRGEAEVVLICRHNEWRSAVSRGDKRSWRGRGETCSTDFFNFSLQQSGRGQAAKGSSGLQQDPCFLHLGRDNSCLWSKMWEDRDQDSSEQRLKSRHLEDAGATKIKVQVWILTFNENENSLTFAWCVSDALRTLKDVGERVSDPSSSHCGRVQNRWQPMTQKKFLR